MIVTRKGSVISLVVPVMAVLAKLVAELVRWSASGCKGRNMDHGRRDRYIDRSRCRFDFIPRL